MLAYRYNLSPQTIYDALLEFNRLHILHYVPRKRTPYIIYTTSREEPKYVLIPKSIYETLRERMRQRIEAVIAYCYRDDICREKYLVEYFGDSGAEPCGHCDICIARRKHSDHRPEDVQQGILYMAQVKPRLLKEVVQTLSFSKDEIIETVSMLVDEGFLVHLDDDTYVNPEPLK